MPKKSHSWYLTALNAHCPSSILHWHVVELAYGNIKTVTSINEYWTHVCFNICLSFSFVCHVVVYKTNCMFSLDWVGKNIGKYITSPVVTSKKSIMCVNLQWRTHTVYIIWFMHARMYKSRHTHELLFTYCCYNDTWCVPWLTERVNITIGQLQKYHSTIFLAKICPTNNIYTVNKTLFETIDFSAYFAWFIYSYCLK